jgi:hypothetical protein
MVVEVLQRCARLLAALVLAAGTITMLASPAHADGCYNWGRTLSEGMSGEDVRQLQIRVSGYPAGRLDRRLFDVTELLRLRYDDKQRDNLPLIITYESGPLTAGVGRLTAAGVDVTAALPSVNGQAVHAAVPARPGRAGRRRADAMDGDTAAAGTARSCRPDNRPPRRLWPTSIPATNAGVTASDRVQALLDGSIDLVFAEYSQAA